MHRIIKIGTLFVILVSMFGCAESRHIIQQKQSVGRSGVFKEYKTGDVVPPSMSILTISSSFKTHKDGYYILESGKSPHGKPYYNILVNIDGQPIEWVIESKPENSSLYDEDGRRSSDPEAGNGVRYALVKKIVLLPGRHRVFFSLPDDGYYNEFDIFLLKGDGNLLELKPVYHSGGRTPRMRSFIHEVAFFKAYYNAICCLGD